MGWQPQTVLHTSYPVSFAYVHSTSHRWKQLDLLSELEFPACLGSTAREIWHAPVLLAHQGVCVILQSLFDCLVLIRSLPPSAPYLQALLCLFVSLTAFFLPSAQHSLK